MQFMRFQQTISTNKNDGNHLTDSLGGKASSGNADVAPERMEEET